MVNDAVVYGKGGVSTVVNNYFYNNLNFSIENIRLSFLIHYVIRDFYLFVSYFVSGFFFYSLTTFYTSYSYIKYLLNLNLSPLYLYEFINNNLVGIFSLSSNGDGGLKSYSLRTENYISNSVDSSQYKNSMSLVFSDISSS
jgi:H+/Cl- antiporter ClcA